MPVSNLQEVNISGITTSMAVYFDRGNPAVAATFSGSVAAYFDPSNPAVNAQFANIGHTASIFTISGSTSTAGNNTLVSPSVAYNFKIFAYSLQTTGIVSLAARFTTGASAGATELWRPLATSNQTSSTPVGANAFVSPPSFLFATGTNTTLALYLDTGTLTHYSVSYIKETG